MIKRTLYFGNPAYLSLKLEQLVIKIPESTDKPRTVPIEDIGIVVLDNNQITITQGVLEALLANNVALITCDERHHPIGLNLPLDGNTIQGERFRTQIEASLPLKKQLWQQTIQQKILNQAALLDKAYGITIKNMQVWANDVRSGDPDNYEARAAVYYWGNMFPTIEGFGRNPIGSPPNNLLNYGYAILRAIVARALVCSGLLPTLGIHHHNRYNAYALADDIMEPYRPYVDQIVIELAERGLATGALTKEIKRELLQIPTIEVTIGSRRSPLMVAVTQTTASLAKCFNGELRRVAYPTLI
ncbi:MAG: type II CRISPR-associated endonuclease Cas1 [Bacteroidales bacterium]